MIIRYSQSINCNRCLKNMKMFMNTTPGLSAALISSHISGKLYLKEDKLNFHFKLWLSSKLFYNIVEFVALENYKGKLNSSIVMLLGLRWKYYCKLWFLSNLNPFQATLIHDYAQGCFFFFFEKKVKTGNVDFPNLLVGTYTCST